MSRKGEDRDDLGHPHERGGPADFERERPQGTPVGRRVVLGMLGLGVAGVAVGASLQRGVNRALAPIGQIGDVLPGAGGFRYYSVVGGVRPRTPERHRITVGGLVREPRAFDMAELAALPQTRLTRDFQCVTGWRVPDVMWAGVALPDLLDAAGVSPRARAVRFTSFDGVYTESLTLEQARRRDVLVATEMLGAPVTHDHGGPVRLFVAPMYGYKSLKWLEGIELTDRVVSGYWERRGYDVDAWVGRSNGRDDVPT
ncbi:molybdopterin-dependent oxidoreductase [Actinomadura viridis]|uniref:molybdopterin-dependent oxidoreductase n=1 Tax=Actinomadura viridis TaxID=58110 RepID=UPI0036ABC046